MSSEDHITAGHCLNCNKELRGRYCHYCGQDSYDHQHTVWHLFKHFFEDITHYDGKLWKTTKPLLGRPGLLTQEYLAGKRASYLNPVRMFIFLNFVFFLLLLSLPSSNNKQQRKQIVSASITGDETKGIDSIGTIKGKVPIKVLGTAGTSAEYDSVQKTLPPGKRDGFFTRKGNEKVLDLAQEITKNPDYLFEKAGEAFLHNAAKLTFVFLILCSILLWLLYYRQRVLMVNHALFSIHLACTFLLLSIIMVLVAYLPFGDYLLLAVFLYGNYYFYRALRNVYRQRPGKTFTKFVIINFFLGLGMVLALLINGLYALISV